MRDEHDHPSEPADPDAVPRSGWDQRLDRNLIELLQELRVTQTGVQVLTGFLLTVPFSDRFAGLATRQHVIYLAVLGGAVTTTLLLVAPVAYHRVLFRRGRRATIVAAAHRFARAGLATLGVTVAGVTWLVFDVVAGVTAGLVAGAVTLVAAGTCWIALPLAALRRDGPVAPGA